MEIPSHGHSAYSPNNIYTCWTFGTYWIFQLFGHYACLSRELSDVQPRWLYSIDHNRPKSHRSWKVWGLPLRDRRLAAIVIAGLCKNVPYKMTETDKYQKWADRKVHSENLLWISAFFLNTLIFEVMLEQNLWVWFSTNSGCNTFFLNMAKFQSVI